MAIVFPRSIPFDVTSAVRTPLTWPDPCPVTGRRRVMLAEWSSRPDKLVDDYAYWFVLEDARAGLDPWRLVEGVEQNTADNFDVLFVNGCFVTAREDAAFLYVKPEHYEAIKLGK